jgi:membrane protein implicated in regulation of membrane protease activity
MNMQAWHIWVIAGVVLIIFEMFTISFVLASFGVACLLAAIAAALDVGLNGQLAVFAVASVVSLFAIRPLFHKRVYLHSEQRKTGSAAMIGQSGIVVERVGGPTAPGRVKIAGEEWRAIAASAGDSFEPGTAVEISAVDSATLVVQPRKASIISSTSAP